MVVRHLKVHFDKTAAYVWFAYCVLRTAGFVRARHARLRIVR